MASPQATIGKSLILSQTYDVKETPLWTTQIPYNYLEAKNGKLHDDFVFLGSNLTIWMRDLATGMLYPSFTDPTIVGCKLTSYKEIQTPSLEGWYYLAGKQLDLLIRPLFDELIEENDREVFYIQRGGIIKKQRHTFQGERDIALYNDKFFLIMGESKMDIMEIDTGIIVGTIDDIPQEGKMVLCGDRVTVWSLTESIRMVIELGDNDNKKYMVFITKITKTSEGQKIYGASENFLLTANNLIINLYDASGNITWKMDISNSTTTLGGVVESFVSSNLAFVLNDRGIRTVYVHQEGVFIQKKVGTISHKGMILYENKLYITPSNKGLVLLDVTIYPYFIEQKRLPCYHILERCLRVSPSYGWVLEMSPLETKPDSDMVFNVRSILARPLYPYAHKKWENTIATTTRCVIPPFVFYDTKMQMRMVVQEPHRNNKEITLKLRTWDSSSFKLTPDEFHMQDIPIPDEGDYIGKWYKTEKWIVLAFGTYAFIFNKDGVKMSRGMKIGTHILWVGGFDACLWFLGGTLVRTVVDLDQNSVYYTRQIESVAYWDGIVEPVFLDLDTNFYLGNAAVTGVRNEGCGKPLLSSDIIMSTPTLECSWYKIRYDTKKGVFDVNNRFAGVENLKYSTLCSTVDPLGRLYFARGMNIYVYIPWEDKSALKADVLASTVRKSSQKLPVHMDDDRVHTMEVGQKYVWFSMNSGYYRIETNGTGLSLVIPMYQPIKCVPILGESGFLPELIVASEGIYPYDPTTDKTDMEAIFEGNEYLWLSNRPYQINHKPSVLYNRRRDVIVSGKGKLCVLTTNISDIDNERELDPVLYRSFALRTPKVLSKTNEMRQGKLETSNHGKRIVTSTFLEIAL